MEDISKFEAVLDAIIEKKGAVCPDLFMRTGRRARPALKGGRALKRAPRARQVKETLALKPIHSDNFAAAKALIDDHEE